MINNKETITTTKKASKGQIFDKLVNLVVYMEWGGLLTGRERVKRLLMKRETNRLKDKKNMNEWGGGLSDEIKRAGV